MRARRHVQSGQLHGPTLPSSSSELVAMKAAPHTATTTTSFLGNEHLLPLGRHTPDGPVTYADDAITPKHDPVDASSSSPCRLENCNPVGS
jgi:hypothetical protein